jgi:protein-S-isoprenylcysteine O-methyltransferase Ste14
MSFVCSFNHFIFLMSFKLDHDLTYTIHYIMDVLYTVLMLDRLLLLTVVLIRIIFLVYLAIKGRKAIESVETPSSRLSSFIIYLLILSCVLLLYIPQTSPHFRWAFIQVSNPTTRLILAIIGGGILLFSNVLFFMVHVHLGKNFSAVVARMEDHTLTTTGPYRIARHPMYTSFFTIIIGMFISFGNWLLSFILMVLAMYPSIYVI